MGAKRFEKSEKEGREVRADETLCSCFRLVISAAPPHLGSVQEGDRWHILEGFSHALEEKKPLAVPMILQCCVSGAEMLGESFKAFRSYRGD